MFVMARAAPEDTWGSSVWELIGWWQCMGARCGKTHHRERLVVVREPTVEEMIEWARFLDARRVHHAATV